MGIEKYTYSRLIPCPKCQSESIGCQSVQRKGEGVWRAAVRCLECAHVINHIGTEGQDFFRTAADCFSIWNHQKRAAA